MAAPKRQKWLDVYDEETGMYKAQLMGETPAVLTSPGQPSSQPIKEEDTKAQKNENASSSISVSAGGNVDPTVAPTDNNGEDSTSIQEEKGSSHTSNAPNPPSEDQKTIKSPDAPMSTASTAHQQEDSHTQDQIADPSPQASGLATLVDPSADHTQSTPQATSPSHNDTNTVSPSPLDDQKIFTGQNILSTSGENWNATWLDKEAANENYRYRDLDNESSASSQSYQELSEHLIGYIKEWVQTTHEAIADLMEPTEHPVELGVEKKVPGIKKTTKHIITQAERSAHKAAQRKAAMEILELEVENDEIRAKGDRGVPLYSARRLATLQQMKSQAEKDIQLEGESKKAAASQREVVAQQDTASQQEAVTQNDAARQEAASQQEAANPQDIMNPREIRTPIHIRPALSEDLRQVMEIYNAEIKTASTLLDKVPVSIGEFVKLHENARKNHLPFLVAIKGWYDRDNGSGPIVGFCLMDTAIKGISGSSTTHAHGSGKLTIVVRPEFRRLNVCSAMIDTTLYCCSLNYKAHLGYQIVNPDEDRTMMKPLHNIRQWNTIDIEAIVRSTIDKGHEEVDPQFKWISDYLEKYYKMELVSRDVALYKAGDAWYDRVTFRHRCRPLGGDMSTPNS